MTRQSQQLDQPVVRQRSGCATALALLTWVLACGGDDSDDSAVGATENPVGSPDASTAPSLCDQTACGGDIEGKWTVSDSCLLTREFPGCSEGVIDVSDARMEGTMEFQKDGTYITTVGTVGVMRMEMPAHCLSGQTCDGFEENLGAQTGDDFSSIECGMSDDVCRCDMRGQPQTRVGTYTKFGDVIVASSPDSSGGVHTDMFDYCVVDGQLRLGTAAGEPSPVSMRLSMRR